MKSYNAENSGEVSFDTKGLTGFQFSALAHLIKDPQWGCLCLLLPSVWYWHQVRAFTTSIHLFIYSVFFSVFVNCFCLPSVYGLMCYTCLGANPGSCTRICPLGYDYCSTTLGRLQLTRWGALMFAFSNSILGQVMFVVFLCYSCWKYDHQRVLEKRYVQHSWFFGYQML